jgi:hypothetical protein
MQKKNRYGKIASNNPKAQRKTPPRWMMDALSNLFHTRIQLDTAHRDTSSVDSKNLQNSMARNNPKARRKTPRCPKVSELNDRQHVKWYTYPVEML